MRRVLFHVALAAVAVTVLSNGRVNGTPLAVTHTGTAASESARSSEAASNSDDATAGRFDLALLRPLQHLPGVSPAAAMVATGSRAASSLADVIAPPVVAVEMYAENFRETETFYFTLDGQLRGRSQEELEHFFRCKRSGRTHKIDQHLTAMLADVAREFDGKVIELVSAYRRPGLGAKHSKHFIGHALDFRVRGVAKSVVRDYVWAKYPEHIGLGYYHQGFLHMDYRPTEKKVGWTQYHAGAPNHYDPAWTRKGPKAQDKSDSADAARASSDEEDAHDDHPVEHKRRMVGS